MNHPMITDQDIKKMKSIFATKEDLKRFAAKDDLKGFATKEDLKGFATKEDLKSFRNELRLEFVTKNDFQKGIDDLVRLITNGFNRMDNAIKKLDENNETLTNHEHRLDRIEDKIFA